MKIFPALLSSTTTFLTKTHQTPCNVNTLRLQNFKIWQTASQNQGNAAIIFYFVFQLYFRQSANKWFLTAVTKCGNTERNAKFCLSYSAYSSTCDPQSILAFSWAVQSELVLVRVTSITSTRLHRCHYPLFSDNCSWAKTHFKQFTQPLWQTLRSQRHHTSFCFRPNTVISFSKGNRQIRAWNSSAFDFPLNATLVEVLVSWISQWYCMYFRSNVQPNESLERSWELGKKAWFALHCEVHVW